MKIRVKVCGPDGIGYYLPDPVIPTFNPGLKPSPGAPAYIDWQSILRQKNILLHLRSIK